MESLYLHQGHSVVGRRVLFECWLVVHSHDHSPRLRVTIQGGAVEFYPPACIGPLVLVRETGDASCDKVSARQGIVFTTL
jgi:hypothetical protein